MVEMDDQQHSFQASVAQLSPTARFNWMLGRFELTITLCHREGVMIILVRSRQGTDAPSFWH
jgi:hypothetical protein